MSFPCPQVQIHSFDDIVSEKEAVIQEVSAKHHLFFPYHFKIHVAAVIIQQVKLLHTFSNY